jgi:hypothetical protein
VGHPPLTSRHEAIDELRARLHARHDAPLARVRATFAVEVARRPTARGLTRVVLLQVSGPDSENPAETTSWPLDTRRWSGAVLEHHSLADVEEQIDQVLRRYAAR